MEASLACFAELRWGEEARPRLRRAVPWASDLQDQSCGAGGARGARGARRARTPAADVETLAASWAKRVRLTQYSKCEEHAVLRER